MLCNIFHVINFMKYIFIIQIFSIDEILDTKYSKL